MKSQPISQSIFFYAVKKVFFAVKKVFFAVKLILFFAVNLINAVNLKHAINAKTIKSVYENFLEFVSGQISSFGS